MMSIASLVTRHPWLMACLLFWLAPAAHAASSCVVLQYHHISNHTPALTSVTVEQFSEHMDYLRQNGFSVLPLREVVQAITSHGKLPEKCVSLTVDDAYLSVYENAFPLLKSLGWPLTVFVNSEAVDKGISAFMTWDQMREMSRSGVVFENHGHGHIHLIREKPGESPAAREKRIRDDILTAQQRITRELGKAPALFAHPYGEFDTQVKNIIRSIGLTGFGQQSGPVWPGADTGALPRFPMNTRYAGMEGFRTKVNSLPLAVMRADPGEPLVPLRQQRPVLTLTLQGGSYSRPALTCFVNGRTDVSITWSGDTPDQLTVKPDFDLSPGRSRTNCTMPSPEAGRFYWYSHNWFIRNPDGSWYPEY